MRRNVSGQIVGAQINSRADGTALTTGTVTVYVTGDGGTQAAGSVGSGACTHEGQGFYTYAPATAETDYAHVAFTFVHATGVNATVQIYPSFPQTGDNFVRIGAPVGASISADIAGVQSDTNDIQARLPAALVGGRIDSSVGAIAAAAITAASIAADAITDAKVAADVTIASVTGAVGSVTGAVGSVAGNVGGNVTGSVGSVATGGIAAASFAAAAIDAAAIATDAFGALELAAGAASEIATAVRTELATELGLVIAAVPTATENATQLLGTSVDGSTTVAQSMRLHNSALGAKASGMATATATFRDLADSKNRIVATVDADGNRSAVTLDLAA